MTPAAKRDTRVELQRRSAARNAWNEEVDDWTTFAKALARVSYGRADERRAAAMEQGLEVATFTIPATAATRTLAPRDRLLVKGRAWDVTSVVPRDRRELEITASAPEVAAF